MFSASMSAASPTVAHRPSPDRARIAAISAALVLNLAVLLIASRPISPAQLSMVHALIPVPLIQFIDPPAVLPPPPPVELKPLPHPPTPVAARVLPAPQAAPIVVPSTAAQTAAAPLPALSTTDSAPGPVTAAPIEASLAYRSAPLSFPVQALRQRMQGTVLLRVLVDETGKPLEVVVEHGSGYALLDRSAREQVLAAWRFQPAMVGGHAVRAWARVPVNFNLREL